MTKPFKGVLTHWYKVKNTWGRPILLAEIVWHKDYDSTISDEFCPGHTIRTSAVVRITNKGMYSLCETMNSQYVLLKKGYP
jgi:hypothetical protein